MGNNIVDSLAVAYHLNRLKILFTLNASFIIFIVFIRAARFCLIFNCYIFRFLNFKVFDKCSELFNEYDFVSCILIHVSFNYLIFQFVVPPCAE